LQDIILEFYLRALLEENEDQLLKDNLINTLHLFNRSDYMMNAIISIIRYYSDKTDILISEMLRAYDEIDETNLRERLLWNGNIWVMYMELGDDKNIEKADREHDLLLEEIRIAGTYQRQVDEGQITIEAVPPKYRPSVERALNIRTNDN
jgi:hypothetical protein